MGVSPFGCWTLGSCASNRTLREGPHEAPLRIRPPGGASQGTRMTLARAALAAALAIALLAAPLAVRAQPAGKVSRLGVLLFNTPAADPNLSAFLGALRALGYVEGRNVALEYRYAEGRPERVSELALQIASLKPDVVVVLGGDMVPFVRNATATIPVVMLTSQDPVEAGVVASFARPGGNLTGVAFVSSETAGKRLQFLKEAVPSLTRVAVLWSPDHPDGEYRNTEATARRLGIQIQSLEVRGPGISTGRSRPPRGSVPRHWLWCPRGS